MKRMNVVFALMIFLALMENCPLRAAETAEQLIAGAKKEGTRSSLSRERKLSADEKASPSWRRASTRNMD